MFIQRNVAYLLLIVMLGLIALGLVMLSSTSGMLAPAHMSGVYTKLIKQCEWLVMGGIACAILSRYDYQKLQRFAPWFLGFACFLLVLCMIFGARVNGSTRWLHFGGFSCQPSEFAKLALILFLSWWVGKNQRHIRELKRGLVLPVLCTLPLLGLMVKQQDYGTTAIMLLMIVGILFVAGTRFVYLFPLPIISFAGLIVYVVSTPERWSRIMAWWHFVTHPETGIVGIKFNQQLQALIALGSGGLWGLGLGNSRQKMYWLPEVNTDFVFPIIGEELGMWVTLAIVVSFLILMLCGGWITIHAPDPSGVVLGTGITMMIALQVLMNLAVATALMPCKGIPLPFISYGGSNLLTCLAGIGILFNMHRQGVYQTSTTKPLKPASFSVRM